MDNFSMLALGGHYFEVLHMEERGIMPMERVLRRQKQFYFDFIITAFPNVIER